MKKIIGKLIHALTMLAITIGLVIYWWVVLTLHWAE